MALRRQRERSFDMPLSDLGSPDRSIVPYCIAYEYSGDIPRKWYVQNAPSGGSRLTRFQPTGKNRYNIHFQGYESERHEAEVHYTVKLLDGTVVASSGENDIPLTVKLTEENVMEGFKLAIISMQPGEKAIFTIPQAWALAKFGYQESIPSGMPLDQTLRFDIELVSLITDIIGDQGIMKKTTKFGNGDKLPHDEDEVLVKYNACLEGGASVSKSEGVEFRPAEGFFCSAFAHVIKTMTKGEEAIVIIKPEYGFGGQGRPSTGNELAVPPNATLYVNLQLISWKIVTHVGENMEIVKRIIYEENTVPNARRPRNGAVVKVRLIGKLQDGTVFDSRGHNGDDAFKFVIDEEHVIYGLDEAVMTMAEGEVASFTIPPQHAFGAVGSTQYPLAVVPPDSFVTYEIELASVVNEKPSLEYWVFPDDKNIIAAARMKEREGDDLFNLGKYLRAYRRYFRARQILRSTLLGPDAVNYLKQKLKNKESLTETLQRCKQASDDVKQLLICLALKSAKCAMQLQRYEQAFDRYHEVLEYDQGNAKALQMVTQSFPKTPVAIDANAMHRGLEEELVQQFYSPIEELSAGASPSERRTKYGHKESGSDIFVPQIVRDSVSTIPETTPGQSPVGSASNSSSPVGSASNSSRTNERKHSLRS